MEKIIFLIKVYFSILIIFLIFYRSSIVSIKTLSHLVLFTNGNNKEISRFTKLACFNIFHVMKTKIPFSDVGVFLRRQHNNTFLSTPSRVFTLLKKELKNNETRRKKLGLTSENSNEQKKDWYSVIEKNSMNCAKLKRVPCTCNGQSKIKHINFIRSL